MSAKKWPPPGFPLVEGLCLLTANWSIRLPEPFAQRVEDGDLVLWRPGLTVWLAAWKNDRNQSRAERLATLKQAINPESFAEKETEAAGLTCFSYRLHDENEDGPVETVSGFAFSDHGDLQIAVYFDDPSDEANARSIVDSVEYREHSKPHAGSDQPRGTD